MNVPANLDLIAKIALAKAANKISTHNAEKKAAKTEKREALKAELETLTASK